MIYETNSTQDFINDGKKSVYIRGLKPKSRHDNERKQEIIEAMIRFFDAGLEIPREWIKEYLSYYR